VFRQGRQRECAKFESVFEAQVKDDAMLSGEGTDTERYRNAGDDL
jgi:hypothetical protein